MSKTNGGKNAKIIPKVWYIFMYLLFKNISTTKEVNINSKI